MGRAATKEDLSAAIAKAKEAGVDESVLGKATERLASLEKEEQVRAEQAEALERAATKEELSAAIAKAKEAGLDESVLAKATERLASLEKEEQVRAEEALERAAT